jgi:hypothetical protein
MFEWDIESSHSIFDHHYGFGAGYAVNTIVGPVQFLAFWSDLSRSVGFHFSLGFDF